ncbi:MAG: general secretion pathway protein GspB [Mariprofundales bacterium]|nr:general secretion pathway protein GspB [Mariprofundales bacterium]
MSYILEALQRADQERKQAEAMATPSVVESTLSYSPSPTWSRWLRWSIYLLLAGVVLWQVTSALHTPGAEQLPAATVEKVTAAPKLVEPLPPPPAKPLPKVQRAPAVTEQIETTPAPTTIAEPTALPSSPVALAELPFKVREQLPAIHIAALINHTDPARRVAWINDKSHHIGDWIADGVRLTAISERDITLQFHGYKIVMTPFQ